MANVEVVATAASLTVTPQSADVNLNVSVSATTAELVVCGGAITTYPSANVDDGLWDHDTEQDDEVYTISDEYYIGNLYGDWYYNFIIFRNVRIPNGATVESAEVNIVSSFDESGTTVNAIIYANDIDDVSSAPATATIGNALDLTTAYVEWSDIEAWSNGVQYTTPDIKTIIQEIVNRAGWESGNDLMIIIKDNSSTPDTDAYRSGKTYNTGSSPELDVSFSVSNAADVEVDIVHVNATTATLTASGQAATISYDIDVTATTDTLAITANDAAIWAGAEWTAWITANAKKVVKLYYFVLTGDADGTTDVTIPISSWQARRKDGEPTFLSVVIPGTSYQTQIEARTSGTMKINLAYLVGGVEQYRETICEADFEPDLMTIHEGGRNQSIILQGHRTETFTPKTIALQDVNYVANNNGTYRYRCASCDLYLNPGDTATYDGNTITVNQIVYSVGGGLQTMEVLESET